MEPRCPRCNSFNIERFFRQPRAADEKNFEYLRCRDCDYTYRVYLPKPQE